MKLIESVYVYRMFLGNKAAWNGRYHSHRENEFEIHFFLEGSGTFLSNRQRILIENRSLFITQPLEFHSILPDRIEKPITYYAVLFSVDKKNEQELFQRLCKACKGSQKRITVEEGAVQFIFEEIFKMSNTENELLKKSAELLMEGLLYRIFGGNSGKSEGVNLNAHEASAVNAGHISRAMKIMENRIYENLKIEEIACEMGISCEHFIRIFRQKMNITPMQYFYRLKTKAAAAMICNTSLSIGDISKKFSFENQFHFSRIFKKCTGLCPSEYRKMYGRL